MVKTMLVGNDDGTKFVSALDKVLEDILSRPGTTLIDIKFQSLIVNNNNSITVADRALVIYQEDEV